MDFNIFGSTPEYYTGLLGQEATDKLRKRATGTGIANALLALVAQPRNQGYGSALPYIGKALMAGQQAGQNVVEGGLRDFDVQQRIADMKRKQEQQKAFDEASKNLYTTTPAQFENVTTSGGYAPAQTSIQDNQVSPNYNLTKLPDVTTQREIAPETQTLNQAALQQMMLSGDPRASQYLSGLKTLKELSAPQQPDLVKLGVGEVAYDPVKGEYVAEGLPAQPKTVDVGGDLDAQALADYNKSFNDINPQERQAVINKVNLEKTSRAAATATKMPAAQKAIFEVDQKTLEGLIANANSARTIAAQTRNINSLIGNRKGSGLIKFGADAQNFLGIQSPEAKVNQAVQALATTAAVGIRTPGSGSTSDIEFNAYRATFPSLATSNEGRQLMAKIADANAQRMSKLSDWARKEFQNNTFSYDALNAYDASLGQAVSDDIKKRVNALTGGQNANSGWSAEEIK